MGIVDDDIVRVREATDIVAVISQHLQLKRVGRRWQGLCPFHNEKSPSFSVNAEQGLYHCFGCKKSGDAITFVREIEGLDFVGAVEHLAAKAGITLRYTTQGESEGHKRKAKLLGAVERAAAWYHERLLSAPDAGAARRYLRDRGFDGDLVRRYQLGWAPDDWDSLARELRVSDEVFTDSGLGFVNRRGRQQDMFRARVLFPIHDVNGAPVGFGGRVLPGADGPKYKNSPESAIYHKSRMLYGLHRAKEAVVAADEVIVCEGYTDVIGFARAGIERAVATCGTALTDDHVKILKRFARRIVLAFDADAAGQAAAERFYEWEQRHEIDVAVADLPTGLDPGELAQTDPGRLATAIEGAEPFLGFRVDRVLEAGDVSTPEGRARAAAQALDLVREHPRDLVRDQYVMLIADRCRIDADRLRADLARPRGARVAEAEPLLESRPFRIADDPEVNVLRLAVLRPEVVPAYVSPALFDDGLHAAVFRTLLGSESLHDAIADAEPTVGEVLRQLAVQDEPDVEPEAVIARFLHDAAVRELRRIEEQGRVSADPELGRRMGELQLAIGAVRDSYWKIEVAERLLGWLHTESGEAA